jgi:hypothetical protein
MRKYNISSMTTIQRWVLQTSSLWTESSEQLENTTQHPGISGQSRVSDYLIYEHGEVFAMCNLRLDGEF